MAVEAVRACLRGDAGSRIGSVSFASTTPVFSDLQNASLVASAAGLPSDLSTLDVTGSLRAGNVGADPRTRILAGRDDAIVVAADDRHAKPGSVQEMQYGAGSVALRIGGGEVIARFVGSASSVTPFVDHFRAEGQKYDYQWEERWIRDEGYLKIVPETVERLLKSTGTEPGAIDCFCLPSTIAGVAAAVAKRLKLKPEAVVDALAARCGDTGAAHTLMLLAAALESARPGRRSCWSVSAPVATRCSSRRPRRSRATSRRPVLLQRSPAASPRRATTSCCRSRASSISTGGCARRRTQRPR